MVFLIQNTQNRDGAVCKQRGMNLSRRRARRTIGKSPWKQPEEEVEKRRDEIAQEAGKGAAAGSPEPPACYEPAQAYAEAGLGRCNMETPPFGSNTKATCVRSSSHAGDAGEVPGQGRRAIPYGAGRLFHRAFPPVPAQRATLPELLRSCQTVPMHRQQRGVNLRARRLRRTFPRAGTSL